MYKIILFALLPFFQFSKPSPSDIKKGFLLHFQALDLSDDGTRMVGIGQGKIKVIDTKSFKPIAFHQTSGNQVENVRISGNGKHLFWAQNWKVYYGRIRNGKIEDIQHLPVGRGWLDIEVNYDGSHALVAVDFPDYYKDGKRQCSPGKRLIMNIRRDHNNFSYSLFDPTTKYCEWINYAELMPDGTLIYEYQDGNDASKHHLYTAIPDGMTDWGFDKILHKTDKFVWQSMTNDGELLTVSDCSLFMNKRDHRGNWSIREDILPEHDYCAGPWFACISPDGKKVVWLRYLRDDALNITQSDFMISRFEDGQWQPPQVLISAFQDAIRFPQIKTARLSNNNFVLADWGGRVYFMDKLDGDGTILSEN